MFDIRTQLVRPGRDSIYRWKDKDANFAAALLGSLTGVLTAAMQAAGGEPVAGTKSVTRHVKAPVNRAPRPDAPVTPASLTDADERAVMDALSDAVRPFRDAAAKTKG